MKKLTIGIPVYKAKETISRFKGLKYRMECIGTFDGVTYYNDTIATIPEATINACKTIDNLVSEIGEAYLKLKTKYNDGMLVMPMIDEAGFSAIVNNADKNKAIINIEKILKD